MLRSKSVDQRNTGSRCEDINIVIRAQTVSGPSRRNLRSYSVHQRGSAPTDDDVEVGDNRPVGQNALPRGRRSQPKSKAVNPGVTAANDNIVVIPSVEARGRRSRSKSKAGKPGTHSKFDHEEASAMVHTNTVAVSDLAHTNSLFIDEFVSARRDLDKMRSDNEHLSKLDKDNQMIIGKLTNDCMQKDEHIHRLQSKVRDLTKRLGRCFVSL